MKIISIITTTLVLGVACASCQDKSSLKVSFSVSDNTGQPIENASIETHVFDRWQPGEGFGKDLLKRLYVKTDKMGSTVFEASTSRCDLIFSCSKVGFYNHAVAFKSSARTNDRWQPWNPEIKIEMKRVLNPIPLIAKNVSEDFGRHIPLPVVGADVGFDFEAGDWVKPHGKGSVADILIRLDGKTEDASNLYDARLRISFSHPLDGLVFHETETCALRVAHLAPTTGYMPELVKRKAIVPGSTTGVDKGIHKMIDDSNPLENYFLRVRTVVNEKGEITSAHYAKIYGGFQWYATGLIKFKYYFNPKANDRNLEFDPKRNLLQVLEGQEVKEP